MSSSPAVAPLDLPDYVDPDSSITYIQLPGNVKPVSVWEDEESSALFVEDEEKRERWDERLVVQSGWLYKQDIHLSSLNKEREVVGQYLNVVDAALFRTRPGGGVRGWEKEKKRLEAKNSSAKAQRRRTSAGDVERALGIPQQSWLAPMIAEEPQPEMPVLSEEPEGSEDESVDENELPPWARLHSSTYASHLERAYALLVAFLPVDLLPTLMFPSDAGRIPFLESLSSGQLLCVAYNAAVRKSRKPWGFVAKDAIHDIISLENASSDEKKGRWTFRRTDNLRLFVGALKLRYGVGVVVPPRSAALPPAQPQPIVPTSPSTSREREEQALVFDPKLVASRLEGWDGMLEGLVERWVEGVVHERRGEH